MLLRKWSHLFISMLLMATMLCTTQTLARTLEPSDVRDTIDTLVMQSLRYRGQVGVFAQSLTTGRVLYEKNAHLSLTPASSLKIFTAYSALRYLGPEYTFQTHLFTDAPNTRQPVLAGNLYVRFDGDPELDFADLDTMIAQLTAMGIRIIQGRVFVDDSLYDQIGLAPGTLEEDKHYCYGAPISAVILNRNCLDIGLKPGLKPGTAAKITLPYDIQLPITTTVKTRSIGQRNCQFRVHSLDNIHYELSGCVPLKKRGVSFSLPLANSNQFTRDAIVTLLGRHGIIVQNTPMTMPAGQPTQALLTHHSKPLRELVTSMLKHSDNLIANTLYKKLGATYFHEPGSWENGALAIKNILKSAGMDVSELHMVDGSGLSRQDHVTAAQSVALMATAFHDNRVGQDFFDALPLSGTDGTLKHRMRTMNMLGKVRAKTGTMKGVTSLVGYVETPSKEWIAFAVIANSRGNWPYIRLEDQICQSLRITIP